MRWVRPSLLGLIALVCSACLCGEPEEPRVLDLNVVDGAVYASVENLFNGETWTQRTEDVGSTWTRVDGLPEEATRPVCAQGSCFAVSENEILVETAGGPAVSAFVIPTDRTMFIEKARFTGRPMCHPTGRDMSFSSNVVAITTADGPVGMVSMGDQGLVIVDTEGATRQHINLGIELEPTPFAGSFLGYRGELAALIAAAFLVVAPLGAAWLSATPSFYGNLFWPSLFAAGAAVVFGVVPLELWSRGVIRSYEPAAMLSIAAAVVGAAIAIVIVRRRLGFPPGAARDRGRESRPDDDGDHQLRTSLVHPDL